jgi:hypothetical protein
MCLVMSYFGIYFKAYKVPVTLWRHGYTFPNLPSPLHLPIEKSDFERDFGCWKLLGRLLWLKDETCGWMGFYYWALLEDWEDYREGA